MKVELKVIHDQETGLSVNVYRWIEKDTLRKRLEIANRWMPGTFDPFLVHPYDPEIDGAIAEVRRRSIEQEINAQNPCCSG